MSTRSQIQWEGSDVVIYKHSDGYPDGVMPELSKFVVAFRSGRGDDPVYAPAQYLRWMGVADEEQMRDFEQRYPNQGSRFLGWGVEATDDDGKGIHGDIEYAYFVRSNGDIEVKDPGRDPGNVAIPEMETIGVLPGGKIYIEGQKFPLSRHRTRVRGGRNLSDEG